MSKPNGHRRTQSNSEVDLRNTLYQQAQEEIRHFVEIQHQRSTDSKAQQANNNSKEVIIERLDDDVTLQCQKENCGLNFGNNKKKRLNFNSYQQQDLFLIPEQNDMLSSVEQTQESGKKQCNSNIKEKLMMNMKRSNIYEQKENINKGLMNNMNLLQQIQHIQHQFGIKEQQNQNSIQSERSEINNSINKLSFTKELQKKKQSLPHTNLKQTITPDRKRGPSISSKQSKENSQQQRSDKSAVLSGHLNKEVKDKLKNNFSVSIFNSLMKQDMKKHSKSIRQSECSDQFKKLENQMKRIETEISHIRKRQDLIDETNQTLQIQFMDFVKDSKRQGELSLRKLDQLEAITRRNEESIAYLRQNITSNNKRFDSTMHQTDSSEMSDYHRRFTDFKINPKSFV